MIGQPGKNYGLVVPKKPGQQTRARPAPPKRLPGAGFSLDDDDDGDDVQDDMASKQNFNAMLQVRVCITNVPIYPSNSVHHHRQESHHLVIGQKCSCTKAI